MKIAKNKVSYAYENLGKQRKRGIQMKCHKHHDRDAVSQCVDCGKALCPDCTNRWSIPICDNCTYTRAGNDKNEVIKKILFMIPLFVLGFWYTSDQASFDERLVLGYMLAGLPWGWSFLNRITPNIFLFLPIFGWIIYFALKIIFSLLIGGFILPYKLFMSFRNYQNAQQIQGIIKNNA